MPGSLALAWTVLSLFTVSAILNYCNLLHRVDVPMEEPLVTALHFAIAAAILVLRKRIRRLRELYEEARAAAQSLIELGKIARAIRDGVSSPLQTIAAATYILRRRPASDDAMLDRIDRAVDRIHGLVETLDLYEPQWDELEQSFDAGVELGEQYDGLNRAALRGQHIAR